MNGTMICIAAIALMFVLFVLTISHYEGRYRRDGTLDREASKNFLTIIIGLSAVSFMAVYGLCVIYQDWVASHPWPILITALVFAWFEMKTMKKRTK